MLKVLHGANTLTLWLEPDDAEASRGAPLKEDEAKFQAAEILERSNNITKVYEQ